MAELGNTTLFFAWILTFLNITFHFSGLYFKKERVLSSSKRGIIAVAVLSAVSSLSLWYLLLTKDFSIEYVAHYTNRTLNSLYSISAFWAGMNGSLLFWILILSIYGTILLYTNRKEKNEEMHNYAYLVYDMVLFFFLTISFFLANPFKKLSFTPPDGQGLNPLLQNYWMLIHPVLLYMGYVGFTMPFMYGIASLWLKKADLHWVYKIRRWTLISWLFLSIGIVCGGKWAYVELGWGGYWAWDPVENASFLPWLTATAFLHSIMIQERRGMLKIWNFFLIFLTFILTVTGTYITRTGVLSSVHAFAQSELGSYFLSFIIGWIFLFFSLLYMRRRAFASRYKIGFSLSKEGSFLFNNFLFLGLTFIVFLGTFFPIFSEILTGQKVNLGPPFFNQTAVPVFIILLFLMGFCPSISWRKSNIFFLFKHTGIPLVLFFITLILIFILGTKRIFPLLTYSFSFMVLYIILNEIVKITIASMKKTGKNFFQSLFQMLISNQRRYGGFIVHTSIAIIAIGITASSAFKNEEKFSMKKGEEKSFMNYKIYYEDFVFQNTPHMESARAILKVSQNGKYIGVLAPEIRFYTNWEEPSTEMDVLTTIYGDLYAILKGWEQDGTTHFEIHNNPLIYLVWYGTILLVFGTVFALIPFKRS